MITLYELFLRSTEVKQLIINRCRDNTIPLKYACQEVGIKYKEFMSSYINSRQTVDRGVFTEKQFIQLLELLGVGVRFTMVIDENRDMKEVSKYLEEKWYTKKHGRLNKQEEGFDA